MKKQKRDANIPEDIVINILARLPLQSIVRFKLVCREWKSVTESAFFHNLYQRNSSPNWSILHGNYRGMASSLAELKLDLPHDESSHCNLSLASFTKEKNNIRQIQIVACTDGLVLVRLKYDEDIKRIDYYIGNPVSPQWIQLPPPPPSTLQNVRYNDSGLVTQMYNGALLGYKVVRVSSKATIFGFSQTWTFQIFSSDAGEWTVKQVFCPGRGVFMRDTSNPVSLNGKLHWLDICRRLIVYDFFSNDDQLRAICLPARMEGTEWDHRCSIDCGPSPCGKMICTTSQGYFVLIDVGLIDEVESYNVRVWRLKTDSWKWEKAWEINMASVGLSCMCVPMAVNYFDIDVIYLWDLDRKCFLACNLRTNTKSYGTRKDGLSNTKSYGTRKDGLVYQEDKLCFEPRSSASQFVASLQVVPT